MECVLGVVGRDFALVAADTSAVQSILVHKTDEDKVMVLDSQKLMGASGEPGDRVQFTEFIQKNLHLYQFRNTIPLSTAAAANFTRGELATALRKNPYMVNIILGGYDKDVGASLYYIDYIATLHKIDKVDLVDKCIKEIRLRLVVAPQNFVIKIVDKDGAREYARRELVGDNAPAEAATAVVAA
uniref:Proteasome subunit beta n=1 Tax=Zea mays TaxID=4577 RepID=A0A804M2A0_MAIZE